MDEEALILWQDVLDEIAAGRGDGMSCPHCSHRPLEIERLPERITKVTCTSCKKFIEGRFAGA